MRRVVTGLLGGICCYLLVLACSGAVDVCPSLDNENADNSRCCEALKFCCNQFVDKPEDEKTEEEKTQTEECKRFVGGTLASCQSLYSSLTSLSVCKPLKEIPGKE